MIIDVHLGESVRRPRRAPLLLLVVVDHDGGARRGDALLGTLVAAKERSKKSMVVFSLSLCRRAHQVKHWPVLTSS